MDSYLSNKPDNFVDDPEKLYRLRRREAQQAKKLDFVDSKSEDEGSLESPKNPPRQSPRENRLPPMGEQPQECKIGELCTPDIIDLTRGRHLDAYFRFNPRGTSKESCKWRTKTYSMARSMRLCGVWRRWR
jgi:hypothetical protein